MNFENRPTHSLRPYPGNARTHSPKQIKQIARSIERFGFNNPVLVDDDDQIIAGHGRVEAAKLLNMKTVPTVRLSHLSVSEKKAYILADNRLAEKAGWDNEVLAIELQGLVDLGFDVLLTGFEPAEVDIIIEGIGDESEQRENLLPDEPSGPPVCPTSGQKHRRRGKGRPCPALPQGQVNIFNLAKNAGTSVDQIERFYARNLPLSKEMARNLQSFGSG